MDCMRKKWKSDVFLNFRGETRFNFIDHLYASLQRQGIRAFMDDTKLDKGGLISEELMQAIQESQVSVVDCCQVTGQHVLPIFFDVKPCEVRWQSGNYEKAAWEVKDLTMFLLNIIKLISDDKNIKIVVEHPHMNGLSPSDYVLSAFSDVHSSDLEQTSLELLSLKEERAGDYEEYQWQMKNKRILCVLDEFPSQMEDGSGTDDYEENESLLFKNKIVRKGDSMEAADHQMIWQYLVHYTSNLDIQEEEIIHKLRYKKLQEATNKHKPEVTAQRMSSYAISASIFLSNFSIYGQTLLAKYLTTKARASTFIVVDMLGLLSFMMLVWAVGVKILVGGKISRINCALFLLWAILKLFSSDNSMDAVYLPILGIFFIGWHAMSSPENKNHMEEKELLSTSIVKEFC
ncbi:hypothetical protein PIB30_049208 [Stylosanthes scabra]|uniref:ADP-ribosyl cyclase/cyclic ADP-ribose hydrolase n=1 Tax=Stylosanthes scabra TaxID=79078 RepID=A0ABU6YJQ0_9FABA|nr:hypothetical protein [Stylosanthes scabra]